MANLVKTFLLGELVKGMGVTLKNFCPQRHNLFSRRENAAIRAFPRSARATPLSERRGTLHRV